MQFHSVRVFGDARSAGTYALLIRLDSARAVTVGRLGPVRFPAGWYVYAGSALGPGGLAARLMRHAWRYKPLHWHIDYLLVFSALKGAWLIQEPRRRECELARYLARSPDAQIIAPRFGASDCDCVTHLRYFPHRTSVTALLETFVTAR